MPTEPKYRGIQSSHDALTRIALVTGASQGLGLVLSSFLAGKGYALVITARGAEALRNGAEEIRATGGQVIVIPGDVADPAHRRRLVDAVRRFGHLDLLVNNASELGPSPLPPLSTHPLGGMERVLAVNLLAPIALVQEALPLLKLAGGMVVNISSDAARGGYPGWGGYGCSKAALDLASLTLANELRADGVGVVSVDPGAMRTALHQRAFPGQDISDRPRPEVTLPFWAWLLGQDAARVSGKRFEAQAQTWEVLA